MQQNKSKNICLISLKSLAFIGTALALIVMRSVYGNKNGVFKNDTANFVYYGKTRMISLVKYNFCSFLFTKCGTKLADLTEWGTGRKTRVGSFRRFSKPLDVKINRSFFFKRYVRKFSAIFLSSPISRFFATINKQSMYIWSLLCLKDFDLKAQLVYEKYVSFHRPINAETKHVLKKNRLTMPLNEFLLFSILLVTSWQKEPC